MERSPFYVGVIFSDADTSSVHVGVPLEEPLHKKQRRKWDPNQPGPSQSQSSGPSPTESQLQPTSALHLTPKSHRDSNFPSPAEYLETGGSNRSTPKSGDICAPSSSTSDSRKRKLVDNVLDPLQEEIVNYGSDKDSDSGDEDDVHEFMHHLRPERTTFDLWNESLIKEDSTSLSLSQPSSSTGQPPATASGSTGQPPSLESDPNTEASYGPHSLTEFVWEPLPQPPISPQQRREIFTGSVGPVSTFSSPYESFISIWDRSIMEVIAAETNRYAEQVLEAALSTGDLGGYSRKLRYKETDVDELYVFFALILATGIVVKADLTEYWSVKDNVFDTPNFGKYMSYTRFIELSQMLHFVNNQVDISHLARSEANVAKIAPIIQHLNEKFQVLYQLGQCIALDESLTQWKGWLSINQFIKNKAAAKGIKTYEVCDSKSGYLWRFKVHAGRDEQEHPYGYITSLVLELLKGLENKGHSVFMDNFYNSPLLARLLKSLGFDCVGTLRLNRQHVPTEVKDLIKQPLAAGSIHGATSGDVDILVWKDRNVVSLLSTYHGAASASRDRKSKPTLVQDYNVRMGGVDKKDQMLASYPIERKRTAVWYKKFFRRLLNISVFNAFVLHKESAVPEHPHPHLTKHRQFRKDLVLQILAKHSETRVLLQPMKSSANVKFSPAIIQHFPREFPYNEKLKQRKRGYCAVCRKRTQFQCISCNKALCLEDCFIKFHT